MQGGRERRRSMSMLSSDCDSYLLTVCRAPMKVSLISPSYEPLLAERVRNHRSSSNQLTDAYEAYTFHINLRVQVSGKVVYPIFY